LLFFCIHLYRHTAFEQAREIRARARALRKRVKLKEMIVLRGVVKVRQGQVVQEHSTESVWANTHLIQSHHVRKSTREALINIFRRLPNFDGSKSTNFTKIRGLAWYGCS